MKIGVISDTHLGEPHSEFKKVIESHFRDVEKILHAGDFVDWSIVEYLSSLKELIAVCGNMDPPDIRKAFPHKRIIELGGFRIGLIHGGGAPFGIESRIREEFDEVAYAANSAEAGSAAKAGPELQRPSVDVIVYGHNHKPANNKVK